MSKQTIYLTRHATPDWSRTDIRYDIPPGPPLTAQGEAEAEKLGIFLASAGVTQTLRQPLGTHPTHRNHRRPGPWHPRHHRGRHRRVAARGR